MLPDGVAFQTKLVGKLLFHCGGVCSVHEGIVRKVQVRPEAQSVYARVIASACFAASPDKLPEFLVSGTKAGVPELVFFRVKLMLLEPADAGMGSRPHIQAVVPVSIAGVFCHKAFVFREFVIELDHIEVICAAFEMAGAPPAMGIHRLESEEFEYQIKKEVYEEKRTEKQRHNFREKNRKDFDEKLHEYFQVLERIDACPVFRVWHA